MKEKTLSLLKDIRFWIVLFFLIRLIGITNAPLEISHNWRQSLTAMIARNFLFEDANLLYPRIDMAGNESGIIGSEFPFFNYLIYLVSKIFGYAHWYGRLINLITCSLASWYFFKLIRESINERTAFASTIVLLSSIWFAFSRKVMPDTFSVSLVISGLWFGYQYARSGRFLKLGIAVVLVTLGVLCKIPAASLLAVLLVALMSKQIPQQRKLWLIAAMAIPAAATIWWYFVWVPNLLETYHYQLYFPKTLGEGIAEILPLTPQFLEKFYFSALSSYLAFAIFLFGCYQLRKGEYRKLNYGILGISGIFLIFTVKTGAVFPTHNYYVIPFSPVMAVIAGIGIASIPQRFFWIPLVLIGIEGIANQLHDLKVPKDSKYKLELEATMDKFVPKNELIVVNGGQSPQEIYFLHRKGWTKGFEELTTENLNGFIQKGAKYLIIDKRFSDSKYGEFTLKFEDENVRIYQLK